MIPSRRFFFLGATAFLAAPSIVRVASLMPVSVQKVIAPPPGDPLGQKGFAYPSMYTGAFEPKFVAPQGSFYMQTGTNALYINTGGADWSGVMVPVTVTADASRHLPRDHHEAV